MRIKFSWNFHQNVFKLTTYFIALNVAIEFVLIYCPHPVQKFTFISTDQGTNFHWLCQILKDL